ncbi:hypothetical protein TRFO_01053 [Tritrichomonas foetus]|uniref:Initiator binding domain-containing protein n=1 Tax=Tritrichomonas foetus TaxID=1144522 RepID=A0A1J4KMX9_9EUKA|nr:hypothetical protein TRFO_01053 [Tritrichomonas foetus]|eukprot:OHT11156.1 hypothetical protein TRFO_01053 [Tritrichomonas foetus]
MMSSGNVERPPHWDLLSEDDKEVYIGISKVLSAPTNRNKRNRRIDDFKEIVDALEIFIEKDEEEAWKRRLVCGICLLDNGIAVNIARLRKIIFKCKSSINGSLKGLGYGSVISRTSSCTELFEKIPFLKSNTAELRQWTVRMRTHTQTQGDDEEDITPPACDESDYPDQEPLVGIGIDQSNKHERIQIDDLKDDDENLTPTEGNNFSVIPILSDEMTWSAKDFDANFDFEFDF